jgi:ABC-type sugar transport system ATPase subunit
VNPLIELRNLSVRFDDQDVLKNVALAIQPGESFGLVGPSGQGKTLLLKLIAGLIEPTSGQVFIEEKHGRSAQMSINSFCLRKWGCFFKKMPCLIH